MRSCRMHRWVARIIGKRLLMCWGAAESPGSGAMLEEPPESRDATRVRDHTMRHAERPPGVEARIRTSAPCHRTSFHDLHSPPQRGARWVTENPEPKWQRTTMMMMMMMMMTMMTSYLLAISRIARAPNKVTLSQVTIVSGALMAHAAEPSPRPSCHSAVSWPPWHVWIKIQLLH